MGGKSFTSWRVRDILCAHSTSYHTTSPNKKTKKMALTLFIPLCNSLCLRSPLAYSHTQLTLGVDNAMQNHKKWVKKEKNQDWKPASGRGRVRHGSLYTSQHKKKYSFSLPPSTPYLSTFPCPCPTFPFASLSPFAWLFFFSFNPWRSGASFLFSLSSHSLVPSPFSSFSTSSSNFFLLPAVSSFFSPFPFVLLRFDDIFFDVRFLLLSLIFFFSRDANKNYAHKTHTYHTTNKNPISPYLSPSANSTHNRPTAVHRVQQHNPKLLKNRSYIYVAHESAIFRITLDLIFSLVFTLQQIATIIFRRSVFFFFMLSLSHYCLFIYYYVFLPKRHREFFFFSTNKKPCSFMKREQPLHQ